MDDLVGVSGSVAADGAIERPVQILIDAGVPTPEAGADANESPPTPATPPATNPKAPAKHPPAKVIRKPLKPKR